MPPRAPLSSATTLKRIQREIADLKKEDLGDIVLAPTDENMFLWKGSIPGPDGSVYEGGVFKFEVHLPADYPFSAPKVLFKTRIYHMNISESGGICIDILKGNWSPALSLFKVMLSLSSLLTDPNPKDPLVPAIATQYTRNRKLHDKTAQEWTELYAHPPKPKPKRVPPTSKTVSTSAAKGKKKADHTSTDNDGPILIEDSDDEAPSGRQTRSKAAKRKRGSTQAADIDLLLDGEDTSSSGRPESKRSRLSLGTAANQGEIIVIEDD